MSSLQGRHFGANHKDVRSGAVSDGGAWLEDRYPVSEPMARALDLPTAGLNPQLVKVLDALAGALRFREDRLRPQAGYVVLDALLLPMDEALRTGPGSWLSDAEDDRHARITAEALQELTIGTLLAAARDFGWAHHDLPVKELRQFQDVEPVIRKHFAAKLAKAVYFALESWREAGNVWPLDWRPARRRAPGAA